MKIEHIALYVEDLEGARNFFIKYLGAKSNEGYHNPQTDFRSYFLSFEDGARLEIMQRPEMVNLPKEAARTGYADGYYESCIVVMEGNQVEITV